MCKFKLIENLQSHGGHCFNLYFKPKMKLFCIDDGTGG